MKGFKKLALIVLAAAALGFSATAKAAPILPRAYMFYSAGNNMVAFHQTAGFHMYFNTWRNSAPNWGAYNISFMTGVKGNSKNLPLPTPWKIAKDNKSTGGWVSPKNPYQENWPNVPEPTGLAVIAGAGLLLGRRKREA